MRRFKNILFVANPGTMCKTTLERATTLTENNQASLTVVKVVPCVTAGIGMPKGGPISAELQAATMEKGQQELEALIEPYRKRLVIKTKVLVGTPFLTIIREILRNDHDLVIKVAEHCDWLDRLFGSDDMHLLRKCPCPVWLMKPQALKPYRRVLAAVDVNDDYPVKEMKTRRALNRQILEMASSLALSEFSELHIGCAWHTAAESVLGGVSLELPEKRVKEYVENGRQISTTNLDTLIHDLDSDIGRDALNYINPNAHLIKGSAQGVIPALAKSTEADLIVMGTVARTGIPGFFMGNTAETILNQIDCSVLAIKPPGFVTPVTLEE